MKTSFGLPYTSKVHIAAATGTQQHKKCILVYRHSNNFSMVWSECNLVIKLYVGPDNLGNLVVESRWFECFAVCWTHGLRVAHTHTHIRTLERVDERRARRRRGRKNYYYDGTGAIM